MRIWHPSLIPRLCRQHLLGHWRESLGAHEIIIRFYTTGKKSGYFTHPQVREYFHSPQALYEVLKITRAEMIARGYHPKELPSVTYDTGVEDLRPWQTLDEQIAILRGKNCDCDI